MSNPRQQAMSQAGSQYSVTMATVYVGDQIGKLAEAIAQRRQPKAPYFEAIEASMLEDDPDNPNYVPGRLVR